MKEVIEARAAERRAEERVHEKLVQHALLQTSATKALEQIPQNLGAKGGNCPCFPARSPRTRTREQPIPAAPRPREMSRSVGFDGAAAAPSSSRTSHDASLAGTMLDYFTARNRGETTLEAKSAANSSPPSTSTKYPALDPASVDFERQVSERQMSGRL